MVIRASRYILSDRRAYCYRRIYMSGHMAICISDGTITFPIRVCYRPDSGILINSEINFLSTYCKSFGRSARLQGKELTTVFIAVLNYKLLSSQLFYAQIEE